MVVALKGKRRLYESREGLADSASKIRAQRKFAQGVVVVNEEFGIHKEKKKKKRSDRHAVSPSPTTSPIKRPKTEDFLSFLCYRGTPALSPDLDFFNFLPVTRSKDESIVVLSTKLASGTTKTCSLLHTGSKESLQPVREKLTSCSTPSKDSSKTAGNKSYPKKKADVNVNDIGETPVQMPLAVLVSPKSTRINEQEAQFAISALKLKYQEKRLSKLQAANNIVSKLTRKVKGRVILTRSKAKDKDRLSPKTVTVSRVTDSPDRKLRRNKRSTKQAQYSERRNTPSPDIIYGVRPKDRADKKTFSDNSSSAEDKSSPVENRSTTKVTVRSLRRGRAYVLETKQAIKIRKRLVHHRVSTRASRRNTTSPLRELPMYGVRKKKKIVLKTKQTRSIKKEIGTRRESHDSESSVRPTRKTKENASIYLGLINKDFSSDENESDVDERTRREDESSSNTSSSETKFLEKQYHACLKRENIKVRIAGTTTSKDKNKEKHAKLRRVKLLQEARKKLNKSSKEKDVKIKVPEKRVLRSQSGRDANSSYHKDTEVEEAARVTRRRVTVPLTPCDQPLAGAARKTASQVPRRNIHRSSSSSSSESESESERKPSKRKKYPSTANKAKLAGKPHIHSEEVESSTEDDKLNSEPETAVRKALECKVTKDKSCVRPVSSTSSEDEDEDEDDEEESASDSSESDCSESEDEIPVQKTSIAIQVDMDSEENAEAELNETHSNLDEEPVAMDSEDPTPDYLLESELAHDVHTAAATRPLLIPYNGPSYFPTIGSNTGLISQQHDFSLVFPTLSIPGMPSGIPMHNFAGQLSAYSSILSAQGPMCFTSSPAGTSVSAAAATLQTHIRSVAANLDIPLVRPVVAVGTNSMLTLPFPGSRHHNVSLTRPPITPMNIWADPRNPSQTQTAHYSAFRIPFSSIPSTSTSSRLYTPLASTRASGLAMSHGQIQNPSFSYTQTQKSPALRRLPVSNIPRPSVVGIPVPSRPSQTAQGMSLIQSLPNVSIVPRFDRSSKPISIPPEQAGSSDFSSTSKTEKNKSKSIAKAKELKKGTAGRKRKSSLIPEPTSPLTVRKDSSTPATYTSLSAKKQYKEKEPPDDLSISKRPTSADPFNKLLQSKTCDTGSDKSTPSSPCPSDPIDKDKTREEEKKEPIPEVPAYYPTDEEFQDPLKYIDQIQSDLESIGMVRIVPPRSFRPECNVEDDMRFTAYNHYVHRMHKRWGPNVHERMAILEHLRKSKVDLTAPPMIGGMEVDLTTLYHTVQSFGGLKEVIEKHKWNKVSDAMHIPKAANDRATKLDAIYVKYVLPYEMLSENERKKLLAQVEEKWRCRENRSINDDYSDSESDEEDPFEGVEDCIIKGKSTPLSAYYRVARNTLSMIFRNREPTYSEVEANYWKQVQDKTRHLCVYSGSIDCAGVGWGFPLPKASMKHPWNLKVLANSPGSILRSMGPVMGATVPTLHVGMVFTTYCWYRDPQGLPWVEYLHSGGNKIWYVVPGSHEARFREVLSELMPGQCRNKKIWLPSDSAMVPIELLISRGVPLYRAVQNPGEFLVVFPNAFTSAICTGYVISESVSFALPKWLDTAFQTFEDIRESKEPPVFPLEKLLMSITADTRASIDVLRKVLTLVGPMLKEEFGWRKKLCDIGVSMGKMDEAGGKIRKVSRKKEEKEVFECDSCNYILHFSVVVNKIQEFQYCLPHAIKHLSKAKTHIKSSCLFYDNSEEQLMSLMEAARSRLK